jgi:hypothetical protein
VNYLGVRVLSHGCMVLRRSLTSESGLLVPMQVARRTEIRMSFTFLLIRISPYFNAATKGALFPLA